MKRDERTMARPFIYPDDARYLKHFLGKKYGLTTYADIVHQLIDNEKARDQDDSELTSVSAELASLKEEIKKLEQIQKKLLATHGTAEVTFQVRRNDNGS